MLLRTPCIRTLFLFFVLEAYMCRLSSSFKQLHHSQSRVWVLATPFPIQLSANVPRMAANDNPNSWVSATQQWDPPGVDGSDFSVAKL